MATAAPPQRRSIQKDPWWLRIPLILIVSTFLLIFVVAPLVNVFSRAIEQGWDIVGRTLVEPHTLSALRLTLIATATAVICNLFFGLAAAWAIARFHFKGKTFLTTMIDLPFSVSPVIAGLVFVLIFGRQGYLSFLQDNGFQVLFALPGIILATTFVTFPFIARELIPVLEALGSEEEQAARTLGASGWQMFWYVTLPNIKWGLLYGILLCSARAIGEFGAVSVVSGKEVGKTSTLPVLIENLYQGFGAEASAQAFTVAGLLACLALLTLAFKEYLDWKNRKALEELKKTE